jgi:hypothetical protein
VGFKPTQAVLLPKGDSPRHEIQPKGRKKLKATNERVKPKILNPKLALIPCSSLHERFREKVESRFYYVAYLANVII